MGGPTRALAVIVVALQCAACFSQPWEMVKQSGSLGPGGNLTLSTLQLLPSQRPVVCVVAPAVDSIVGSYFFVSGAHSVDPTTRFEAVLVNRATLVPDES